MKFQIGDIIQGSFSINEKGSTPPILRDTGKALDNKTVVELHAAMGVIEINYSGEVIDIEYRPDMGYKVIVIRLDTPQYCGLCDRLHTTMRFEEQFLIKRGARLI